MRRTVMPACCASQQAVLRPGYLIYRTIGAENTQRLSDFLDIGLNQQPVRAKPRLVLRPGCMIQACTDACISWT